MNAEAQQQKIHRIAKAYNFLEMWQGIQKLYTTLKKSHSQNKQMTAGRYISDTTMIVKEYWSII